MSEHEFWNELGNLYFISGAYEPAIHAYARSIELDRGFGRPYSNMALAFVHTGKYVDAIELYHRSIELLTDDKEKAITWNRLGIYIARSRIITARWSRTSRRTNWIHGRMKNARRPAEMQNIRLPFRCLRST